MAARRFWTVLLPLVLVASVWNPAEGDGRDPETSSEVSARAGTKVSAKVSRSVARVGRKVVVSGKVSGKKKRAVVLETKVSGSWRTLTTGRTNKARRYRLRLPTEWYHQHALRVRAPAAGGRPAGISRTRKVRVRPTYRPVGDRSDHNLPYSAGNYRWNPCKPIEWRFHKGGGFAGSLKVVKRALLEVSRATGLAFTYEGTTSKVPIRDDTSGVADLVIGWTTPQQVGQLSGGTAGYGGARASGPDQQHLEINEAAVALEQTETLAETYADSGRVTWGQVMVHELGHGIGVGHASASNQLMFGTATSANSRLGKGDLRGMELVGLSQGCWNQGAR
jgi:hypothetical protein